MTEVRATPSDFRPRPPILEPLPATLLPDLFEGAQARGRGLRAAADTLAAPEPRRSHPRSVPTERGRTRGAASLELRTTLRQRINRWRMNPPQGATAQSSGTLLRNLFARAFAGDHRLAAADARAGAEFLLRFNALSTEARASLLAHAAALVSTPAAHRAEQKHLAALTRRAVEIHLRPAHTD